LIPKFANKFITWIRAGNSCVFKLGTYIFYGFDNLGINMTRNEVDLFNLN